MQAKWKILLYKTLTYRVSKLDSDSYKIFWTVRLLREATAKAFEKYPKLQDNSDRTWLVWLENGELRSQIFLD